VQQQHRESEEKKSANKPCGLILLTGTPVLNRAEEYFVPLNLVSPEKFSSIERFRRQWLEQDSKGRWNRVKRYLIDDFKNEIKPYLIRYEKEDVYKELPALNKIFTIIEPDRETYAKEYNRILDKMEAKLADKANPTFWDMQDDMMALRRICGMMKTTWTADYLEAAALESSAKYAVGIHHESVRDFLYLKLGGDLNCYKLSGQDNAEKKDWIMRNWEHSNKQFLIINMLAGGVGMDFHYCDNVLVLERQWNSEMESQFEFRFYNPDLSIKKNSTQVEYILAKGTLDEWWYDMVEAKRQVVGETVYNNWDLQSDQSTFKQLVEKTVGSRL
jgi:SNF2 family DNA or RNA helicase